MLQSTLLPSYAWLIAALPLVLLVVLMIFVKMKGTSASAISWAAAALTAFLIFGITPMGFLIANAKGIALAVFVLLIIWTSILLYNIVHASGAVTVIGTGISEVTADKTLQLLLLGWCFSSLIQGVAGFGVPVAVTAPLLAGIGFSPVVAASAVLVGHAWAVTFGSMASSYFTVRLVSTVSDAQLTFWLGILFIPAVILTGLAVVHLQEGWAGVRRRLPLVLGAGVLMGVLKLVTAYFGAVQLATVIPAAAGMAVISAYAGKKTAKPSLKPDHAMNFSSAVLPYGILMVLVVIFQIGPLKQAVSSLQIGWNFPAMETLRGFRTAEETNYAAIRLFGHPAPFLLLASVIGVLFYTSRGYLDREKLNKAFAATKKQCVKPTITIFLLVMMALIMNDSGMTSSLAGGLARVSGVFFPVVSPFIGVLGSFMTGSNTNSNILFGAFQQQVAIDIGVPAALLLASQSVGGSLGSAIAPAKVVLGASTTGGIEQSGTILSITVKYCMIITGIIGIFVFLLSLVL